MPQWWFPPPAPRSRPSYSPAFSSTVAPGAELPRSAPIARQNSRTGMEGLPITSSFGRHIVHDAGLSRRSAPVTDRQMARDARLRRDGDEIPERRGARDTRLTDDDATTPRLHVVPDLHQVVEARARPQHGVALAAAIDAGIRARSRTKSPSNTRPSCGIVSNRPSGRRGEAEAFLADPGTGMQHHAAAEDGMADAAIGMQPAAIADLDPGPDRHMRVQDAAGADPRPRADDDAGADLRPFAHHRIRRHHRAGMDAGDRLHRRMQQRRDPGEAEIGLRRHQSHGTRRHLRGEGPQQHHRAGPGFLQQRRIAAVVEEADVVRPCRLQRRDAGEAPLPVALELRAGGGGDIGQPLRAAAGEEARIRHGAARPLSDAVAAGLARPAARPGVRPGRWPRRAPRCRSPRAAC